MPEVNFCRAVRFRAKHHYQVPEWTEQRNREVFGPAAEPHEHDWRLTVWLRGPLAPETGMLIDLVELDRMLHHEVVEPFNGRSFREGDAWFETHQPTTEVLAGYFAERLSKAIEQAELVRLRIEECEDLFAEWHP